MGEITGAGRGAAPKGLWIGSLMVLFLVSGCLGTTCTPGLQYEGVYKAPIPAPGLSTEQVYSYLRFYPEGEVIGVSSTGEPDRIRSWFDRGADVSQGRWSVFRQDIAFTVTSPQGAVSYGGTMKGNTLLLDVHSHINDVKSRREYTFVPW